MFCFWPLNNSVEFARVLWLDRDVLERESSHLRFSSVAFSVASLLDRQASRLPSQLLGAWALLALLRNSRAPFQAKRLISPG